MKLKSLNPQAFIDPLLNVLPFQYDIASMTFIYWSKWRQTTLWFWWLHRI